MKKAVIILPTYNEKDNIANVVTLLEEEVFPSIKTYEMGILVADDSSPDGTADVVRDLMKKWHNVEISVGEKKGLGAAYLRGMSYAVEHMKADVLFEMDADLQHDPKKIPDFLAKIDEGYDFVIGSRYIKGGGIPANWGLDRKIFSITANIIIRAILGRINPHEWTNGYRAIRKEVFLKLKDKLTLYNGYVFQVSFMHMALQEKFKVAEIPFVFMDRTHGQSKIASGAYISDIMKYLITARLKELERFIKFLFVGGTGFLVQVLVQEGSINSGFVLLLAPLVTTMLTIFNMSHDPAIIADSIGGGLGAEAAILSNFLLNNFWTFSDTKKIKEQGSFWGKLFKFNFASLLSIVIQALSVGIGETVFGKTMHILNFAFKTRILILFPTIIFIVIPINYIIYNKLIWKTQYLKK